MPSALKPYNPKPKPDFFLTQEISQAGLTFIILLRRIFLTIDKVKYAKVKVNPKKIDSHNYPPG
jgi:hypothetical protein